MSTTAKALQVLVLFRDGRTHLRAIDVMEALDVSSATAYRYMADLEGIGLIERSSINEYVLGPTIVELDRRIRESDPLIAAAKDVMKSLTERTGGTALLCRLHGRKVVCVHQVRGRSGPVVSYERGKAMPLFLGATSKIILAHMGVDVLREIATSQAEELRKARLPVVFDELSDAMTLLRAEKVCITHSEIDSGVRGFAAAIHQGRNLLGSLSIVLSDQIVLPNRKQVADQVLRAALRIEGRLKPPGN
ncbi:transcriptional regulator [Pseudomonas sp. GM33]|uniref:IclR family transcriptional regulator n=1 Tax=Pseudomonas sp. GM33 TaxID=1144329 RepID=UPI00026FF1E1|nr:IclR family transcriptional regulator [Pseudomonas sp. GM33]EJM34479.1 transcriptional regulator [Pseudomonas sp. GM33]